MKNINVFWMLLMATLLMACTNSKTYYIDSINGDDSYKGTSESSSWKTLTKLNKKIFKPGDKILFKSGTVYYGQFEPKGNGTDENPIIVDKYGGDIKPAIHGDGEKKHTVMLKNISYWEVNNLEITNTGQFEEAGRNGVYVYAWNIGDINHIYLKNLTVHDVNGSCIKNAGAGNGIYWHNGGDSIPTRFIDLRIEDCHVYNCQRNGINSSGNSSRNKWHPSLNVVIRRNLIEKIPGDGIVPIGCDGALVEYNVVRDSPDLLRIEDAAAGIWPWSSDNTIIQYNEVSTQNAKWDGQGFDSDYNCRNTTIQYNLSHNNAGGFVMVCNEGNSLGQPFNIGTENTLIKGNVSINDGLRAYPTRPGWFSPTIHISGPAKNTSLEDNLILIYKKPMGEIDRTILMVDNWGGPWSENTHFKNNTIYVVNDPAEYRFVYGNGVNITFEANTFYGNFKNKPQDKSAIQGKTGMEKNVVFPDGFPESLKKKALNVINSLLVN